MYFFRISLMGGGGIAWIVGEDEGDCYFLVGWIVFGSRRLFLSMFRAFCMAFLTRCVGYPLFVKCLSMSDAAFS